MLGFLTANGGTIAVAAVLLTVVALIAAKLIKNKKAGKHACCGDCAKCCNCGAKHNSAN